MARPGGDGGQKQLKGQGTCCKDLREGLDETQDALDADCRFGN